MREQRLAWLLEAKTPTIRYSAQVDLMELAEEDARVQEARQAIMRQGPVSVLRIASLALQLPSRVQFPLTKLPWPGWTRRASGAGSAKSRARSFAAEA